MGHCQVQWRFNWTHNSNSLLNVISNQIRCTVLYSLQMLAGQTWRWLILSVSVSNSNHNSNWMQKPNFTPDFLTVTYCWHECDAVKVSFKFSLNWTQSSKILWSTSNSMHGSEFTEFVIPESVLFTDRIPPLRTVSPGSGELGFVSLHRLLSHY